MSFNSLFQKRPGRVEHSARLLSPQRSPAARVAPAVVTQTQPANQPKTKIDRFKDAPPPTNKGLKEKRGKKLEDMTDSEFEYFARNFDDAMYWEMQAQRGVYKERGSGNQQQYEADEYEQ